MWRKICFLSLLMLISLQGLVLPVSAHCWDDDEATFQQYVDAAEAIFVGTIIVIDNSGSSRVNLHLSVEKYLKGTGPDMVLLTIGEICADGFDVGNKWSFFSPDLDQHHFYFFHSSSKHMQEQISLAVGHDPVAPYPTPIWTLIHLWTYTPAFRLGALVGAPALAILGAIGIYRLRRRHVGKKKKNDQ